LSRSALEESLYNQQHQAEEPLLAPEKSEGQLIFDQIVSKTRNRELIPTSKVIRVLIIEIILCN